MQLRSQVYVYNIFLNKKEGERVLTVTGHAVIFQSNVILQLTNGTNGCEKEKNIREIAEYNHFHFRI